MYSVPAACATRQQPIAFSMEPLMFRFRRRAMALVVVLASAGWLAGDLPGQGVPEPDLVIYGAVINVWDNANLRLGHGTLTWVHRPADGGAPVRVSTELGNFWNQYSYVLRVPCETEVPGVPASPDKISLTPGGLTFSRSEVSWDGNALTFAQPALASTAIAVADRGRIERVDFEISVPVVVDENGLPVDWQMLYFGRTGVDPQADPDGDGMSTGAEYLAGTDPTDPDSALAFIDVTLVGGGMQLEWWSVAGRSYAVQRSSNLVGEFIDVATGLGATPPSNVWNDVSAPGAGLHFYRLRIEP